LATNSIWDMLRKAVLQGRNTAHKASAATWMARKGRAMRNATEDRRRPYLRPVPARMVTYSPLVNTSMARFTTGSVPMAVLARPVWK